MTQKIVLDLKNDEEIKCMISDAKLLNNLLEQTQRVFIKDSDYLWPGALTGQPKTSVISEIAKSIINHCHNIDSQNKIWL